MIKQVKLYVDQANKDYEATEQLKNDTLSKLETVNKNVEAKKTELENSKVAHQNAINDVAAKQAAVDKAQTDVDSFRLNRYIGDLLI